MAAFDLPKTTGNNFGTGSRIAPLVSRSPGPAAYDTASTLSFRSSTLSISRSNASFTMAGRHGNGASRTRPTEGTLTPLRLRPSLGEQEPSSMIRTSSAFSIGLKEPRRQVRTPGPLDYRPAVSSDRIYDQKADRSFGTDDRFGDLAQRTADWSYVPHSSAYNASDALTRSDNYTRASRPFGVRAPLKMETAVGPGPQPNVCGSGVSGGRDRVMYESPKVSIGLKLEVPRTPMQPSPTTYDARSLYWSANKSALGRAQTPLGRSHSSVGLSLHKDVQSSQPGPSPSPPRF